MRDLPIACDDEKDSSEISSERRLSQKRVTGRSTFSQNRRDPEFIARDLVTAMAVCHNVTPVMSADSEETSVEEETNF